MRTHQKWNSECFEVKWTEVKPNWGQRIFLGWVNFSLHLRALISTRTKPEFACSDSSRIVHTFLTTSVPHNTDVISRKYEKAALRRKRRFVVSSTESPRAVDRFISNQSYRQNFYLHPSEFWKYFNRLWRTAQLLRIHYRDLFTKVSGVIEVESWKSLEFWRHSRIGNGCDYTLNCNEMEVKFVW